MRSNRPQAKFRLKLDSYRCVIDFFDPNDAAGLTRRDNTIQIWTINSILNLNLIENISNLIKFNRKWSNSIENVKINQKSSRFQSNLIK